MVNAITEPFRVTFENITGMMFGCEECVERAAGTSGKGERESYDFMRAVIATGGRVTEWARKT